MARTKELTPQELLFAQEFVKTGNAYKSALTAGYSQKTASKKAFRWLDDSRNVDEGFKPLLFQEVERLKCIVQTQAEEEFRVSIKQHYNKLREVQEMAMLPDEKGNYKNLATAAKCEEIIGHLFGLYEKDNMQKSGYGIVVQVASQEIKDKIDRL